MDISRAITLHLPKRIEIGKGAAERLGDWAKPYARVFVVAQPVTAPMVDKLGLSGDVSVFTDVAPEPKDTDLTAALKAARALPRPSFMNDVMKKLSPAIRRLSPRMKPPPVPVSMRMPASM